MKCLKVSSTHIDDRALRVRGDVIRVVVVSGVQHDGDDDREQECGRAEESHDDPEPLPLATQTTRVVAAAVLLERVAAVLLLVARLLILLNFVLPRSRRPSSALRHFELQSVVQLIDVQIRVAPHSEFITTVRERIYADLISRIMLH